MTDEYRRGPGFTRDDASMNAVERGRAVLARRKAGERRHIAAIAGTTEWAPLHPPANLNDGRLPTAAFDWPIYVAAYTQRTEDCQSYGHRDPFYGDSVLPEITEAEARLLGRNR